MRYLASMFLALVLCCSALAGNEVDALFDSVCRITAKNGASQSYGTGCTFAIHSNYVWVMTAAHVVENASTVECEFWHRGHISENMPAEVVQVGQGAKIDGAVIAIPQESFGGILPKPIRLASLEEQNAAIADGSTLVWVGCANGAWATAVRGHSIGTGVFSENNLNTLFFRPPPSDGRSGSAILNQSCDRIVGVLWGRDEEEGRGLGTPINDIKTLFMQTGLNLDNVIKYTQYSSIVQVPYRLNQNCGPGGCNPFQNRPGILIPNRNRQQQQPPQGVAPRWNGPSPWQSLPPSEEIPAPIPREEPTPPIVDISVPIEDPVVEEPTLGHISYWWVGFPPLLVLVTFLTVGSRHLAHALGKKGK